MDAAVSTRSFSDIEPAMSAMVAARHLPFIGSFELTYRCNFDCVHCFEQDMREQVELSGDRWCELIDEIAAQGCLFLTLTGGEAAIHPDFERIYEHAVRRGLLVTVFSNGSTLSESVARLFARLPPRSVEVTLYGFSAETYERSTGRARNFALAMAGVARMKALSVPVQIKTVVFDETAADFPAIRDFARDGGFDFRFDTNVHATLKGGAAPLAHRLSPEQIIEIERQDPATHNQMRARAATSAANPTDRVYRCGAGRFAFNVTPDGYLQLCSLVRALRFDLRKVSFASAWEALGGETRRRYDSVHRRCSNCSLQHMCGTCPGVADLEHGDPEAAIDHICETTHLRASAIFGREIVPPWKKQRPRSLRVLSQGEAHVPEPRQASCGAGCGCAGAAAV